MSVHVLCSFKIYVFKKPKSKTLLRYQAMQCLATFLHFRTDKIKNTTLNISI